MATLQKIRNQAGLLIVVIGVALLSFIIGDFLSSGNTFLQMGRNNVAKVNGTAITPVPMWTIVALKSNIVNQPLQMR
ncbi:MAG: SurA N-terminal domain-containing protein [Paludibacteraceae bacterium]|nr:SurA N-terminal domain-containing protein [Paludibacteraceae bacterium]